MHVRHVMRDVTRSGCCLQVWKGVGSRGALGPLGTIWRACELTDAAMCAGVYGAPNTLHHVRRQPQRVAGLRGSDAPGLGIGRKLLTSNANVDIKPSPFYTGQSWISS